MKIIVAAAIALAAATPALGAPSGVIRASSGSVRAELTFGKTGEVVTDARLTVTRAGRVRLDSRISGFGRPFARPVGLSARDLDADSEPEVVLSVYTGGAHCCVQTLIYRYLPDRGSYRRTFRDWGNVGFHLVDLDGDGRLELRSADDRFAYAFACYACSGFPMRIWRYDHGRLLDVTRSFPRLVERDAERQWRWYMRERSRESAEVRGLLAAWLADMYLLGREDEGWQTLEGAYRRGELGPKQSLAGWPQGRAYIRALRTFLRKTGYAARTPPSGPVR
jgi:hypothetical protein